MSSESEISERVKVMENIILGPKGHPEDSLVVTVENLTKSIGTLVKFSWAMLITTSGLIIKGVFAVMTNI
jgi:hypothetical protein